MGPRGAGRKRESSSARRVHVSLVDGRDRTPCDINIPIGPRRSPAAVSVHAVTPSRRKRPSFSLLDRPCHLMKCICSRSPRLLSTFFCHLVTIRAGNLQIRSRFLPTNRFQDPRTSLIPQMTGIQRRLVLRRAVRPWFPGMLGCLGVDRCAD